MRSLLRGIRRSGAATTVVALAIPVVLVAGIVTAGVRHGDGATTPAATVVSVDTSGWVLVVDRQVGFTDRLPQRPVNQTLPPIKIGTRRLTVWIAAVHRSVLIEREDVPDLTGSELAAAFRAAIYAFAGSSGLDIKSEGPTTFHGQLARQGTFTSHDGRSYKVLVFDDGGGGLYMIAATPGYFDAVTTSFHPFTPIRGPVRRGRRPQAPGKSA